MALVRPAAVALATAALATAAVGSAATAQAANSTAPVQQISTSTARVAPAAEVVSGYFAPATFQSNLYAAAAKLESQLASRSATTAVQTAKNCQADAPAPSAVAPWRTDPAVWLAFGGGAYAQSAEEAPSWAQDQVALNYYAAAGWGAWACTK